MTRQCGECGSRSLRAFSGKAFVVAHAGATRTVKDLAGWRCGECGEVIFDVASAKRYAAAGDELVQRERARQGAEVRRIREKLGLTQQQAAALTGGGHNAFSRYERGEAAPMPAVIHLLRLLDNHPELLNDAALSHLVGGHGHKLAKPKRVGRSAAPRRKRTAA